ncbi:MAG: glycosyltransferase, partial [Gammaproteobacteria bacterium]|nr:glycosyltransferase [Gammaproteobacteria bacterium]
MNPHKQNLIYLAGRYDDLFGEQLSYIHNHFDNIFILTFHRAFKKDPSIYSSIRLPKNVTVVKVGNYLPPVRLSYSFGYLGNIIYSQLLKLYALKAVKYIKKNRIDATIVHAHFVLPSGLLASYLKDMVGSKAILTAHGYDVYDLPFKNKYTKKLSQTVLKKCDKIITVSNANASILEDLDFHDAIVIPNGFDSNIFFAMD